jgi:two-component system alkaline phosphatase synthesis response regulator PhoP
MIWFVGKTLEQYQPVIRSLNVNRIQSRQYASLTDVLNLIDEKPQAIVIDMDGIETLTLEFCWIVTHNLNPKRTNILLFSSNSDESLEVSAFQSGASDFILKPFKDQPVVSRISSRIGFTNENSMLRSSGNGQQTLEINKDEFSVIYDGNEITFSRKEFELLYLLASHPGKVFSREEIYKKIWTGAFDPKERTIDVHILRVRKKLDDNVISTLKGVGYRFNLKHCSAF